jgi:hypothetical protein
MNSPLADLLRRRIGLVLAATMLAPKIVSSADTADTGEEDRICLEPSEEAGICRTADDAMSEIQDKARCEVESASEVSSVGDCCYEVVCVGDSVGMQDCGCYGRPYWEGDRLVRAEALSSDRWAASVRMPSVEGLTAAEREALGQFWLDNAIAEHSSVAGFHRFALDLLAHGAPTQLLLAAGRAAAEEVRHAQLCAALASAYFGRPIGPGRLPRGTQAPVARDLVELSALLAATMCDHASDPAVRHVLSIIARDEASHAALAWQTLRWAVEEGGEAVERAIAPALLAGVAPSKSNSVGPAHLTGHGILSAELASEVVAMGMQDVVHPSAKLLGSRNQTCAWA